MRELDYELQVPQDDMSAMFGVEVAKCCDNTPEKREIHYVLVEPRPDLKAKVECDAGEYGVREVEVDTKMIAHGFCDLGTVSVKSRGPDTDGIYEKGIRKSSWRFRGLTALESHYSANGSIPEKLVDERLDWPGIQLHGIGLALSSDETDVNRAESTALVSPLFLAEICSVPNFIDEVKGVCAIHHIRVIVWPSKKNGDDDAVDNNGTRMAKQ